MHHKLSAHLSNQNKYYLFTFQACWEWEPTWWHPSFQWVSSQAHIKALTFWRATCVGPGTHDECHTTRTDDWKHSRPLFIALPLSDSTRYLLESALNWSRQAQDEKYIQDHCRRPFSYQRMVEPVGWGLGTDFRAWTLVTARFQSGVWRQVLLLLGGRWRYGPWRGKLLRTTNESARLKWIRDESDDMWVSFLKDEKMKNEETMMSGAW